MDQAEPQPLPGQPEQPLRGQPQQPVPGAAQPGAAQPGGAQPNGAQPDAASPDGPQPHRRPCDVPSPGDGPGPALELDHPVVVGYDGSGSSRHALAYAAGMARRLGRPLLLAYITSPSIFCEPLSGQVIAPIRDSSETHRWLLAELDEVCDREGLDVRIVTRQGSPARELAAAADEFGADALVIGAPARIWHQVAGSVPGRLARHAHCPVIVVP
jgi:nucleotide-binding universal stress UspA family protein